MTLDEELQSFRTSLLNSIAASEQLIASGFEHFASSSAEFERDCIAALSAVSSLSELRALQTRYEEVMEGLVVSQCLRNCGGLQ
jgi:hypothetical protein